MFSRNFCRKKVVEVCQCFYEIFQKQNSFSILLVGISSVKISRNFCSAKKKSKKVKVSYDLKNFLQKSIISSLCLFDFHSISVCFSACFSPTDHYITPLILFSRKSRVWMLMDFPTHIVESVLFHQMEVM